jgi:UDP-N-acetylglucosamine--N-acetylmuramyl-(pentapeptide) pyrophosphoryl-undecaprenol N-acetylglucosamine transferase
LIAAPFRVAFAVWQVLRTLRRRRPAAVLGMGGFVSGPGGVAAWLCRKPLLIHEQNAVAGTTNRLLARFARRVFEAFPGSFAAGVSAEYIGNPVRRSILGLPEPGERLRPDPARPLRLLVLGGSQGARVLNRTVPAAVAQLAENDRPEIMHQTGAGIDDARAHYDEVGVAARLEPFVDDMAAAYAWADLVVARAGALTMAELAACGVGAVLVPYPFAIDDHQTKNAAQFVAAGAATVIAESELTPARLAAELGTLCRDRARLLRMAEQARRQAKPRAATDLAEACLELAGVAP